MNITKIFLSPSLWPFLYGTFFNIQFKMIRVLIRESALHKVNEYIYIPNTISELRNIIYELHRVQVTMSIPVSSKLSNIQQNKSFLIFEPIESEFKKSKKQILKSQIGESISLKKCFWINDKKTKRAY